MMNVYTLSSPPLILPTSIPPQVFIEHSILLTKSPAFIEPPVSFILQCQDDVERQLCTCCAVFCTIFYFLILIILFINAKVQKYHTTQQRLEELLKSVTQADKHLKKKLNSMCSQSMDSTNNNSWLLKDLDLRVLEDLHTLRSQQWLHIFCAGCAGVCCLLQWCDCCMWWSLSLAGNTYCE